MKIIDKPWGKEEIITIQDKYVVKRLYMKKGKRCSLQYHKKKVETIYVLSGVLLLHLGPDTTNTLSSTICMRPGDFQTIPATLPHRMEAEEDAIYLESSTTELDDVVRLEDDYDRK